MNEQHTFVLMLYSKYSRRCEDILKTLQDYPISFLDLFCIDNKVIRKIVLNSKYGIASVPCILIGYANSRIDKYEGEDCMNWLKQTLAMIYPPVNINQTASVSLSSNTDKEYPEPSEFLKPVKKSLKKAPRKPPKKQPESNKDLAEDLSENEIPISNPSVNDHEPSSEIDIPDRDVPVGRAIKASGKKSVEELAREMEKSREEDMRSTERKRN